MVELRNQETLALLKSLSFGEKGEMTLDADEAVRNHQAVHDQCEDRGQQNQGEAIANHLSAVTSNSYFVYRVTCVFNTRQRGLHSTSSRANSPDVRCFECINPNFANATGCRAPWKVAPSAPRGTAPSPRARLEAERTEGTRRGLEIHGGS
jgi:hypothetical protein